MNSISTLFTTYDRASETYSPPFAAPHSGVAIRGFTDAINNPNKDTDLSRHPDDFDLYEVGLWDSATGQVTPHKEPRSVIQGKQIAIQLGIIS